VYLIDTNVISESRKGARAHPGVIKFFSDVRRDGAALYLSAITIGELRRGADLIRYRGDLDQATRLDHWIQAILAEHADCILSFDLDVAQVWGRLRVPHHENAIDKQIAATALVYDLTLVTRNTPDFTATRCRMINPFFS